MPLIGPQGIFKPALLAEMPISITTVPVREGEARPYDDGVGPDGFLRYRYRGTDRATATIRDCASPWGAGCHSSIYTV